MVIRNQTWFDSEGKMLLRLRDPYWSAWKRYQWEKGVEGFGISKEAIDYALENKLDITISVEKYGSYTINPTRLQKEVLSNRIFIPRDKKALYVLPRTAFNKVISKNNLTLPSAITPPSGKRD